MSNICVFRVSLGSQRLSGFRSYQVVFQNRIIQLYLLLWEKKKYPMEQFAEFCFLIWKHLQVESSRVDASMRAMDTWTDTNFAKAVLCGCTCFIVLEETE